MCLVKIKLSPSHLLSNALIFLEKEILFWPHQQFCTQSFIHYYKVQSSSGKKALKKQQEQIKDLRAVPRDSLYSF
jgi:hypothetical protein